MFIYLYFFFFFFFFLLDDTKAEIKALKGLIQAQSKLPVYFYFFIIIIIIIIYFFFFCAYPFHVYKCSISRPLRRV